LNDNLIWSIGLVDVHTLALGAGLGKLVFLFLAWIYGRSVAGTDRTLRVWQGSCLASGLAFLLIWIRPVAPLWLSLTTANLLLMLAWAMEYHAYQRLLGGGLRPWVLVLITGVASLARVLMHLSAVPLTGVLIYTSLVYGGYFALMALLLITHRRRGELTLLIGVTNAIIAALFLARFVSLLWPSSPELPSVEGIHLVLWISGFLITFVNGFGFLLLVKQDDDCKLRAALADVSLAEAEQRQLLSLASHEFRTPAAIIQSSLDSLKLLAAQIPPAVAARHDNMYRATQRLIHLANALITQDRLRDLRFELVRRELDLVALTSEVVGRYGQPVLWNPPPAPLSASVDPELIAIALYNLIDNALRHSPAGHPPEVRLLQTSDGVQWRVADHGPGVPDADRHALFERFCHKGAGLGSGLGLSIVRRIARLHGGEASLQDQPPHGACFVIQVPANQPSA
jgi:signal transduction histidine kinase